MGNACLPKAIAIIGATASGKTDISLELAEEFEGEIISVDSRQVYRKLDIGTAKATRAERARVPHHLIDVAEPTERFSASRFVELASAAVTGILSRRKTVFLAGGTPFYFRALFSGLLTGDLASAPGIRSELEAALQREGNLRMHERLRSADPETAARIHPNDSVRLVRALEILAVTGEAPSEVFRGRGRMGLEADVLYIGLSRGREDLRKRIALRAARQFDEGFPEEVASLLAEGLDERYPCMQGLGYRDLAAFHRGRVSLAEALERYVKATCAFARRQMTWFSKFEPAVWYDMARSGQESVRNGIRVKIAEHLRGGRS